MHILLLTLYKVNSQYKILIHMKAFFKENILTQILLMRKKNIKKKNNELTKQIKILHLIQMKISK